MSEHEVRLLSSLITIHGGCRPSGQREKGRVENREAEDEELKTKRTSQFHFFFPSFFFKFSFNYKNYFKKKKKRPNLTAVVIET